MQSSKATYVFASEPRPVPGRAKYRDPVKVEQNLPMNIMFDRRVVRGSTYAAQISVPQQSVRKKAGQGASHADAREEAVLRKKRAGGAASSAAISALEGPLPVPGRKHMDVQTEQYLEELADRPTEVVAETQTDGLDDARPAPAAVYMPKHSGVDAATHIGDGDLFVYEVEVEPVLQVLVQDTLQQSLVEVLHEDEMHTLRTQQERLDALRTVELAHVQRLEAAQRRRVVEKEQRLVQECERVHKERQVRAKVAAAAVSRECVETICAGVFSSLARAGVFYNPVDREVEMQFVPWLLNRAMEHLELHRSARLVVGDIVGHAATSYGAEIEQLRATLSQVEIEEHAPMTAVDHDDDDKDGAVSGEGQSADQPRGDPDTNSDEAALSDGDGPQHTNAVLMGEGEGEPGSTSERESKNVDADMDEAASAP